MLCKAAEPRGRPPGITWPGKLVAVAAAVPALVSHGMLVGCMSGIGVVEGRGWGATLSAGGA